eukprot:jgi/Tetstr1/432898/TSEL_002340.t1
MSASTALTSIWTEWFSSYNANVLVPYALGKAPPRPVPRADGAGSSEGESTGPEWVFSPADSLQLLQEYVEINAVTRPIIDQWQKDMLRYHQQTLRVDPASGRIRVPSREDADAFHEFRYRRYVELFETKFNEAPKMRTRYDAYTREGFCETPASLAMTLRELKAHLPDLTWDKVNLKAFDVITSVWRSIPALKQSLDAGFHQLKDIAVLRQSHEDRLDEIAAEVERYEDIAAEAHAGVSVEVMAVDAAMEAHLEADEDRGGTLDLEAMFSRILEKSQAAHGATGATRLAVEVPDPFLDCVDTDDHGTLLHGASCVELPLTVIVIGGVRIQMAMLDTGCDYNGVHRRVVDRMKPGEVDATLQSMSMQGIGGKMEMQRLVGRISYVINPDTDWERKFEWPSFAILEGDHRPDVILCTSVMAHLGMVIDDVPGHVANVIASCFTLRASPMDADYDTDEELPDLMEDSSDDDDVYEELTIMTQTEPDSEPLAAGACYALRAEGPSADNLQEPDCPSDDEELEDGTAVPLREHEDEIPDWRELRRQRQAAGRLHLSGHTLERLALVRAVPHSTPELTYILDLDRTGGKEGRAKQGLFLFVGMLSVLFTNLVEGYHYELIQIVDRMLRSVAHRQRLLRQLEWMHQRWPAQLPRNAFEKCFSLSDEMEHNVEHITAPAILRHLPELDEVRAETPCQDVSSMGTHHGLRGARTGVIVPLAEAMSELNCMLAKARGVKEYWAAPAQYGYVIENAIPAAPSRRSPEVQEFIDFMARVFGEPNGHHAHKCGDASLRSALWRTNTFPQHYYKAVQHEFERPPRETHAQIVERCSGMVEVVGIDPPQYRPSSAVMREACLLDRDYVGFYTRQELGFTEEEMVIAIGNVFEDHSVNTQELRAAQHELRRSTAAAVEAEMEHAINMATLKQGTRPFWAPLASSPLASVRVLALG